MDDEANKQRRKRRRKDEVTRSFQCNIEGCNKAYGSENSLNQHIKLKHFEILEKLKLEGLNDGTQEKSDED